MRKFEEKVQLSQFSNYKIGGPAEFFFEAKSADDVGWAAGEAKKRGLKIFILGGGTNLLIKDKGVKGLVLKPNLNSLEADEETVMAGAGVLMEKLLGFTISKGLSGLEWAGGLPGTVGGAVRGNAGAFGGELKDCIKEIESFDIENSKKITRKREECEFGYRNSIFKKLNGQEIILSAAFALKNGAPEEIKKSISEKIEYRKAKQPLEYPNIGSIFKNVPVELVPKEILPKCADVVKQDPFPIVPAARFITLAGLKGKHSGGAMISPKHGNFIVNVSGAKASDVENLIGLVKKEIQSKFGIELEEEIVRVG
jgi:UDP-N-acetylmuramate dehydrogenase